jgi:hypothetical protein
MEDDEERDDICMRPPSFGCGKVSTGEASVIAVSEAIRVTARDTQDQKDVQGGGVMKIPRLGQGFKGPGGKAEADENDHGLPLAMYPRREICVTLEVATGVGGKSKGERDGNFPGKDDRGRLEGSWSR